jgi:MFS family permease
MAATIAAILPAFLTAGLAVQLRDEFGFDDAGLGFAIGAYFLAAALSSVLLGRAAERLGPARALRITSLAAVAMLVGLASVQSYRQMVAVLAVAGLLNAMAQPAANLMISRTIPSEKQGLAFGIKQSGMPVGTLLAGLAVPTIALTVGWRWAYLAAALVAVAAVVIIPSGRVRAAAGDGDDKSRRAGRLNAPIGPLLVLALGIAFGAAAAGALAAFLVTSTVDAGVSESLAGWTLTFGSAVGITVRLLVGARADRQRTGHLRVVALMLVGGAVAFGIFSLGSPAAYLIATPLAFGLGWAWPGLFNYAIVRNNPDAPGVATGITQTGTYIGAVLGPLTFGWLVHSASYPVAWTVGASWYLAGAVAMILGRRWMLRVKADLGIAAGQPIR